MVTHLIPNPDRQVNPRRISRRRKPPGRRHQIQQPIAIPDRIHPRNHHRPADLRHTNRRPIPTPARARARRAPRPRLRRQNPHRRAIAAAAAQQQPNRRRRHRDRGQRGQRRPHDLDRLPAHRRLPYPA